MAEMLCLREIYRESLLKNLEILADFLYNRPNIPKEVDTMTNKVITISRAFGSGGRTIGREVAKRLGIPCYDKELVAQVAEESGFHADFIEEAGEYAPVTSSFLFNIAVSPNPMAMMNTMSASDQLFVCQTNVIRRLADQGPCVIIGRCADYILRDHPDALHVFIHSDMEHRAKRIVELYGQTKQTPEKRLIEKDNKRKVYYRHYTNRNWGEAQNYHISLNSGLVGIEKCIDIIAEIATAE